MCDHAEIFFLTDYDPVCIFKDDWLRGGQLRQGTQRGSTKSELKACGGEDGENIGRS